MNLFISSSTQTPIYEQIESQIRELIMNGTYTPGMQLPSIRILARELKVGIITCRRAYDDLCEQGFLISHPGKGVFVAEIAKENVKMIALEQLKKQVTELCNNAKKSGIQEDEIIESIHDFFRDSES
jgi:Predicted transcriptional regulators